jgi:hypothetical protein
MQTAFRKGVGLSSPSELKILWEYSYPCILAVAQGVGKEVMKKLKKYKEQKEIKEMRMKNFQYTS